MESSKLLKRTRFILLAQAKWVIANYYVEEKKLKLKLKHNLNSFYYQT
jgi:hypothetical protein